MQKQVVALEVKSVFKMFSTGTTFVMCYGLLFLNEATNLQEPLKCLDVSKMRVAMAGELKTS
jgi:hypothetical protein